MFFAIDPWALSSAAALLSSIPHRQPGQCADMRNAGPHLAGANDADRLDDRHG